MSNILPIVILLSTGLLTIRIMKAFDWGGILLVIAEEKEAFTVIPTLKLVTGIRLPFSLNIRVLLLTTSLTVCAALEQFTQSS
ncbi:MAG: hypothetical protein IJA32_08375 [Lachnospiraceae bacterium]|nr:hypothetical protein [Lachnospiraceae bacterium]